MSSSVLESVLRRDRWVVLGGLGAVTLTAWIYLLLGAGMGMSLSMGSGGGHPSVAALPVPAMEVAAWTSGYAVLMFFMWWVMMVAMMVPSAAPTILLFALVNRRQREAGAPYVPTGLFAGGYLLAWGGFSVLATLLQWGFERVAPLSGMMASTSTALSGSLLIAAGVYQLTPLKHACLKRCRSPLHFLTHRWRTGRAGALAMGVEHGAYCLGCCWALMSLLFVGGVMNLYWIAGLALLVLLEKTVPPGHWLARAVGAALVAWGLAVIVANP